MPLISVIIPIFRVESYISRCLESVCNQTFQNFEIVLVNDCTDDNSVDIALSFLKGRKIPYQLISHAYNQGLSAARNTGIVHSLGEYIYFLDGDDSIEQNCLQVLLDCFKEDPEIDFSMAKYCRVFQDGTVKEQFVFSKKKKFFSKEEMVDLYNKQVLPWNAVNRLIRKDFVVNNKLYFRLGITSEDLMLNFEILHRISKAALIDKTTYHYYVISNSIMNSPVKSKYIYDLFYIIEMMRDICFANKNERLIYYFLCIKYNIMLEILLWNRMPTWHRLFLLKKLYSDRFQSFFSYNTIIRQISFVLPASLLALFQFFKYQFNTYCGIIRYKMLKR